VQARDAVTGKSRRLTLARRKGAREKAALRSASIGRPAGMRLSSLTQMLKQKRGQKSTI